MNDSPGDCQSRGKASSAFYQFSQFFVKKRRFFAKNQIFFKKLLKFFTVYDRMGA